jgi:hypothetical protein
VKHVVVAIFVLAIATSANPASAYVIQVATSIPATSLADDTELKGAVASAIDDVLDHAVAFTPTVVTVQNARVVGNRLYILLLIADRDGEEMMKSLSAEPLDEP